MKFSTPPSDISFPKIEEDVLARWKERRAFERSIEQRPADRCYSFYDGPPFATGLPHYGHLLVGTIKDVVARYQTMSGFRVERRFGWDCHGLPVEFEVEKTLGLQGSRDIEKYGVDRFNETCRSIVLRYADEWRETVTRMGRWVDFDNDYKTMDVAYMESVWHVFKTLWEQGLIYEGTRVVPYSWRIGAPLSNFEANLNYKDVQDPSITIAFRSDDLLLLAWTTTPWTLPSNQALAVDPDADYVVFKLVDEDDRMVMHAGRLDAYWPGDTGIERLETLKGSDLVGRTYEPLFPYFADLAETGSFRVLPADFVTADSGTGIVHTAPAFGEDDFNFGKQHGIEPVDPVDAEGRFMEPVTDYAGLQVKEADKQIIQDLKAAGKLLRHETLVHSYPFCYRSDTPLIYKTIGAWYVNVEAIKQRLIDNNQQITWVPEHLKDGRFGKWLEGARDWNISRNRFWGNPLPIWRNDETGETICVGSRDELEQLAGRKVDDLHKHIVDDVTIPSPTGQGELRRIPEVLDCWFESGAMPYGQAHYPFEDKEAFEEGFPADFICEALDQTRGWFYTLLVLSSALFDKPAFRNVIVSGLVLAEDGRKMSKSLKNYPEPQKLIDEFGADAIRIYLLDSPVLRGEELRFSPDGVREMVRRVLLPWWNSVVFMQTYAAVDGWDPEEHWHDGPPTHELDVWIRAKLEDLKGQVEREMAAYKLYRVVTPLLEFLDDLTNWYIRRSRRRFWKSEADEDKRCAYTTLYSVLLEFTELMAPLTPFVADYVYESLRVTPETRAIDSVHLRDVPTRRELSAQEQEIEGRIDLTRRVCELGRSLRAQSRIRNRQPLRKIRVGTTSHHEAKWLLDSRDVILDELNIKELEVIEDPTRVAHAVIKPNMRNLGPRLGKGAGRIAGALAKLDAATARRLAFGETVEIEGELLGPDDIFVRMEPAAEGDLVSAEGNLVVALDPHIDTGLRLEGIARDFVNRIQRMRKEMDLPVEARIDVGVDDADAEIVEALEKNRELVENETLSSVSTMSLDLSELRKKHDIDGREFTVEIQRRDED
jgi:isoleucyl-tRNA synthetase